MNNKPHLKPEKNPPEKLAVANWKMNITSAARAKELVAAIRPHKNTRTVICPPFTWINALAEYQAKDSTATDATGTPQRGFELGAQDCASTAGGAFTGDVSAEMVKNAGASWVIIGHSERRQNHQEEGEVIRNKLTLAKAAGLETILCVGEAEGESAAEVIERQLQPISLVPTAPSAPTAPLPTAIAYEPIWAIGTGRTPTNEEIAKPIELIKSICPTKVLYGGSVDDKSIHHLSGLKSCDGFLVGGASLDAHKFNQIIAVTAKMG